MEELGRRLARFGSRRRATLAALLWALAVGMVGWTVWGGFHGVNRRLDARPLVLAGHAFLLGESPYSSEVYSRLWEQAFHAPRPEAFVFAYPPSIALLLVPLSLGGVDAGLLLVDLLNLVSLALALGLCSRLGSAAAAPEWRSAACAAALALAATCGSLSGTLRIGQTSLWVLVAALWLWRSAARARLHIADVLALAVLATKPSLTLPLLGFVAVVQPGLTAASAALSLAACAGVAAATSGLSLPGEWLRALTAYSATAANAPLALASVQHLLASIAPGSPTWPLALLGGLAGAVIGCDSRRAARRTLDDERWVAVVALAAACAPAHSYDLVLAAPLAALLLRVRPAAWWWYAVGVAAVARPAVLAHAAAALGAPGETSLEELISALGTALLALGVLSHVALRLPLLCTCARPPAASKAHEAFGPP